MIKEKIIEVLNYLHDYCRHQSSCKTCRFRKGDSYNCEFLGHPQDWDIKRLEQAVQKR